MLSNNSTKVSVIISYYKRQDFLTLILIALNQQTYKNFEVIIAEDNNAIATIEFIKEFNKNTFYNIKLVQQEDIGFRKNRILNAAVKSSIGEVLVFFDGDCIPHKNCIEQYVKNTNDKIILTGRRVMLSKSISDNILHSHKVNSLNLFSLIFSGSKHIEEGIYLPNLFIPKKKNRGILGCNFSVKKAALLEINGFDEDYEKAGAGEDTDLEWRWLKLGYEIKPLKFRVIVYHLFHESNYIEPDVQFNGALMRSKIQLGKTFCINGLQKNTATTTESYY